MKPNINVKLPVWDKRWKWPGGSWQKDPACASSGGGGSATAAIVGGVVGGVVAALAIAAAVYFIKFKAKPPKVQPEGSK